MDNFQILFDIVLGVAGFLGGFILKSIWHDLKELRNQDSALVNAVHNIETLVAGNYIKREEVETKIDALFRKLDKIENHLMERKQ
jgi:hypothetical protein